MDLENYYVIQREALPEHTCDSIVDYALDIKQKVKHSCKAETGGSAFVLNDEDKKDFNKNVRNSNVVWINEPWIYRELWDYINQLNAQSKWNFKVDFAEPCQFTIYKKGQHYNWHIDGGITNPEHKGKIRKLSMTILLSDPKNFEGGDLEFDLQNNKPHSDVNIQSTQGHLKKGSICMFPSFVYHRVTPVTKGTRYSLVVWVLGEPFV